MKKTIQIIALAAAVVAAGAVALHAQLPVSRSAGVTRTALATGLQFVSIPYTAKPVVRGVVETQSGNTVTIKGASGLNSLNGTHTLQILTGANEGRAYTVASFPAGNQTTTVGSLPSLTAGSDEVMVIPNWTLNTLFPNGSTFTKGANPVVADRVYTTQAGTLVSFFHNGTIWRNADNTGDTSDKGGTTIDFDGALLVRGSASPGNASVAGIVRTGDVRVNYTSGLKLLSLRNPTNTTLSASGLASQVLAGANPVVGDRLYLTDSGTLVSFFYNGTIWRNADNTGDTADKGSTVVPANAGILMRGASSSNQVLSFQEDL